MAKVKPSPGCPRTTSPSYYCAAKSRPLSWDHMSP